MHNTKAKGNKSGDRISSSESEKKIDCIIRKMKENNKFVRLRLRITLHVERAQMYNSI